MIIGHHLAQVEEIPTSGYRDVRLDRWMDGRTETPGILICLLYTRFHFYGVIIVHPYCGCCDMLSMFMDEKCHRLVTYPVCELPKTDFCII